MSLPILSTVALAQAPPIPQLALWEQQMTAPGSCAFGTDPDFDHRLLSTYYDRQRVYFQIADYTGDPMANACAQQAEAIYRDEYGDPNDFHLPAYWVFPDGLWMDWLRTGDQTSKDALLALALNAAYADAYPTDGNGDPDWSTQHQDKSREMAYILRLKLLARRVGWQDFTLPLTDSDFPGAWSIDRHVELLFRYFGEWFGCGSVPCASAEYMRPFMVALASEALIAWFEETGDSRVLPALTQAADAMWAHCWLPAAQAFMYTDRATSTGGMEPAPDLNLLIAPVFAWIYKQTGDASYQVRGDQVFASGVEQACLSCNYGKQFNQNYRWSFSYVAWRSQPSGARTLLNPTPIGTGAVAPKAYWKCDEGAGFTVADASGHDNAVALVGQPAWTTGISGAALAFDGGDDHLRADTTHSLNLAQALTITGWIKPDALDHFYSNVVVKGVGGQRGYGLNFRFDKLNFVKVGVEDVTSGVAFAPGIWQHAAITWNAVTGEVKFFRNGVLAEVASAPAGIAAPADGDDLTIGAWPDTGANAFQGVLDQIRIYARVLSEAEVQGLFNSQR